MSLPTNKHPAALMIFFLLCAVALLPLRAELGAQLKESDCAECHAGSTGGSDSPQVDFGQAKGSAHRSLSCIECHTNITALPHQAPLKEVDCLGCHGSSVDVQGRKVGKYRDSVHGRAVGEKLGEDAAGCVDCHGKHDIRGHEDPRSLVYRANIPLTCARCHENNQVVLRHDIHSEKPYQEYEQSIHGKALLKDGLLQVAAICTDCHGVHDIQSADATHPMAAQPATCGACHITILDTYSASIHGRLHLEQQNPDSPGCVDCHGEHGIQSPEIEDAPTSRPNIPRTCAGCHADAVRMAKYDISTDKLDTYKQSFHGVAQGLGDQNAANCASCHGYHDVLPVSDTRSRVHPANLIKTCGSCHPKATANFVSGKIHIDPTQKSAGAIYYLRQAFLWLVYATLAFLVFWVGIDLSRKWKIRKNGN